MHDHFTPANFTKEEIEKIINLEQTWDSEDKDIKDFKNRLYKDLKKNLVCPYCLRELSRKKEDQLEHIILKSDYTNFTFQPWNIIIACKRCNNKKLISNVLKEEHLAHVKTLAWDAYPKDKKYFVIIHPYLDIYSEHIEVVGSIFYKPNNNSTKGSNTIQMMKLNSFDLLEKNAKESLAASSIIRKYVTNPDNDEGITAWANFLIEPISFRNLFFDILIDFENKKDRAIKLNNTDYNILKNAIESDTKYHDRFDVDYNANVGFIKMINRIDIRIVDNIINHLEQLYNLRDINNNFEYALFLAILLLIRRKEGCFRKGYIDKYCASSF